MDVKKFGEISDKEIILHTLFNNSDPFKRFELLERFATLADREDDILTIIEVLKKDPDLVVRHEAAAQLLKIEANKPHLTVNMKQKISNVLIESACNDKNSITARHEAIEALGYLGTEGLIPILRELVDNEIEDISSSARVALHALQFRLKEKISVSEIPDAIIRAERRSLLEKLQRK